MIGMKQQVFNPYLPNWEYIPDKICEGIPEEHVEIFLKTSEKMLENIEKKVYSYIVYTFNKNI